MKLKDIGEFGLLKELGTAEEQLPPGWIGPGDDAASIPAFVGETLITTDLMVQNVHFNTEFTSPEDLGYKALAVNASDIAAMGGRPEAFTVSLVAPPETTVQWLKDFYRGLHAAAKEFSCRLAGGDTSSGRDLMFSIALLGEAPAPGAVLREGAETGDDIFVSGQPGESALGLKILMESLGVNTLGRQKLVQRHLKPTPRLSLGRALGEEALATSMIDVSDGLLKDLSHILEASRAGAEIWIEALPISKELRAEAHDLGADPLNFLFTGGEDYELLFTSKHANRQTVLLLAKETATPISRIGSILPGNGFSLKRAGKEIMPPASQGFDHFTRCS